MAKMSGSDRALSKSKFMAGLQCQKRLYLEVSVPEERAETSASTERQFEEGHEVGERARLQFPGGVLIEGEPWEFSKLAEKTAQAMKSGASAIYEASFLAEGLFARIDILKRGSKKNSWDVVEVKKSTSVKDEHLPDIAFQVHLAKKAGIKVGRCFLMHINNQCVYPDLSNLFTLVDVTKEVASLAKEVEKQISKAKKTLALKSAPNIAIGRHCSAPYECPFMEKCWQGFPEHNVLDLSRSAGWPYFEKGIVRLSDLDSKDFTGVNRRIVEAVKSGKRFIDPNGITSVMKYWKYPLYFLDFETINPAIPRFDGTRPYEQIPFQFSCHILNTSKSKTAEHIEFLHDTSADPREVFVKNLLAAVGNKGSIVSYNKSFEAKVMEKCGLWFPKYEKKLQAVIDRLVDPMPVVSKNVYDPGFHGSFSLKSVAPSLLGEKFDYSDLDVGGGAEAQAMFEEMISAKAPKARAEEIKEALLQYCRLDTLSMVELVKWLKANSESKN